MKKIFFIITILIFNCTSNSAISGGKLVVTAPTCEGTIEILEIIKTEIGKSRTRFQRGSENFALNTVLDAQILGMQTLKDVASDWLHKNCQPI